MSYTLQQITDLRSALARGATRLKMNGEEVQFDSLDAMRRQLAIMEKAIGGSVRVTHFNPEYDRGL